MQRPPPPTFPAQDRLLFQPACADSNNPDCQPFDSQYKAYVRTVERLTETPDAALALNMTDYATILRMQAGAYTALLQRARDLLMEEADPILRVARSQLDVIFGISFVVFAGASLMLRAAVQEVRGGIQRTRRMLLMLPPEVVQRAPPIDAYLKSGRLTMLLEGQGADGGLMTRCHTVFGRLFGRGRQRAQQT
jgi:hypothetical protein